MTSWLNKKLRQRLLGAFVLTALAIIFLPMLLTRTEDDAEPVQVEVPPMPIMPEMPEIQMEPVVVPESPLSINNEEEWMSEDEAEITETWPTDTAISEPAETPVTEQPAIVETTDSESETITVADDEVDLNKTEQQVKSTPTAKPKPPAKPVTQTQAASSTPDKRLDIGNLPISWSVQLASLKNRTNAEKMRNELRSKGYNAYVRSADGMNKVLVGPLIERTDANRLRDELEVKQRLKGFVVRFQP